MTYCQLTSGERYNIAALRGARLNYSQIAKLLGRHRSTISREIRRNRSHYDGKYRTERAIEKTSARRRNSRRNTHFTENQYALVRRKLKQLWSPEQISGRLKKEGLLSISHETIYLYIWKDKAEGGDLYKCLRYASKQRRKRYRAYDSRGRLAGKRHISERPKYIENRKSIGHWEADTVGGARGKDCVATLVERKTGYALVGKLEDRTKVLMSRRLKMLMRRAPGRFKTITPDNGTEFHDYESVEEATDVKFYFATPYHSWERGTNENFNGLLRQYVPKRASMRGLTQKDCDAIAKKLNTRPRKRLGWKTPEECFLGI